MPLKTTSKCLFLSIFGKNSLQISILDLRLGYWSLPKISMPLSKTRSPILLSGWGLINSSRVRSAFLPQRTIHESLLIGWVYMAEFCKIVVLITTILSLISSSLVTDMNCCKTVIYLLPWWTDRRNLFWLGYTSITLPTLKSNSRNYFR